MLSKGWVFATRALYEYDQCAKCIGETTIEWVGKLVLGVAVPYQQLFAATQRRGTIHPMQTLHAKAA